MASFKAIRARGRQLAAAVFLLGCVAPMADAQQQASGFAVDRFYQSAPGGGWFDMDDLDMTGPLGGAICAITGRNGDRQNL